MPDVSFDNPEPDPFSIGHTYMPPTPPQSNQTRTASRKDDLIWSLRTQLAIRQEPNVQYEVNLPPGVNLCLPRPQHVVSLRLILISELQLRGQ